MFHVTCKLDVYLVWWICPQCTVLSIEIISFFSLDLFFFSSLHFSSVIIAKSNFNVIFDSAFTIWYQRCKYFLIFNFRNIFESLDSWLFNIQYKNAECRMPNQFSGSVMLDVEVVCDPFEFNFPKLILILECWGEIKLI